MAMTKIIDPRGWDFDRPVAMMVKVSSRGLIGSDRRDFIKVAGHQFLDAIDGLKVAKDEVPIHLVALGASEYYGPNRNGDGFKAATCKEHHKTFEKYAKWFRNHKNKLSNNDPFYGYVKQSAYNDAMHRVELLAMLNASKEAAERNGGFVADKELEKLAKDEDIPVSMACRVPFDICSGCQKQARTRNEYCTKGTCKYGGCKDNLTKIAEDGHILHVDNPNPVWFDISNVYRPADRIAYGARADWLAKAASHQFTPGAEMAEMLGVTAPLGVCIGQNDAAYWGEHVAGQIKLAQALAAIEHAPLAGTGLDPRWCDGRVMGSLSDAQLALIGPAGSEKAAAALAALADHKIILPLADFARWRGKAAAADAAAELLTGVFGRLAESDDLGERLTHNLFEVGHAKTASVAVRGLASNLVPAFSFEKAAAQDRAMRSAVRHRDVPVLKTGFWNEKQAADHPDAASLADEYAVYKLAALYRIASNDGDFNLTARLAVGQNRVW